MLFQAALTRLEKEGWNSDIEKQLTGQRKPLMKYRMIIEKTMPMLTTVIIRRAPKNL